MPYAAHIRSVFVRAQVCGAVEAAEPVYVRELVDEVGHGRLGGFRTRVGYALVPSVHRGTAPAIGRRGSSPRTGRQSAGADLLHDPAGKRPARIFSTHPPAISRRGSSPRTPPSPGAAARRDRQGSRTRAARPRPRLPPPGPPH